MTNKIDIFGTQIDVEVSEVWFNRQWTNEAVAKYDGKKYRTHDGTDVNGNPRAALDKLIAVLTPIVQAKQAAEKEKAALAWR